MKDKNFVIILLVMMLTNAVFISFGTCVSVIYSNAKPVPFTPAGVSLIGVGTILFGVPSGFLSGIILRKTRKNLLLTHIFLGLTVTSTIIALVLLIYDKKKLIIANSAFFGVAIVPLTPILVNFASEVTFP